MALCPPWSSYNSTSPVGLRSVVVLRPGRPGCPGPVPIRFVHPVIVTKDTNRVAANTTRQYVTRCNPNEQRKDNPTSLTVAGDRSYLRAQGRECRARTTNRGSAITSVVCRMCWGIGGLRLLCLRASEAKAFPLGQATPRAVALVGLQRMGQALTPDLTRGAELELGRIDQMRRRICDNAKAVARDGS